MRNDSADRAGREAAVYWGFAAWAHKARGAATDAFGRWSGTDSPRPEITQARRRRGAEPRYRSVRNIRENFFSALPALLGHVFRSP